MLPTTGHFKVINCPFYDTCICERPYCHFKHSKREAVKDEEQVISELVSQAVHKVLNPELSDEIISEEKVEENDEVPENRSELQKLTYNPTPISELNKIKNNPEEVVPEVKKVKRHIPIQYTPQRPQTIRQNGYSNAKSESKLYTPVGTTTNTDIFYTPSSIKDLLADNEKSDDKSYIPENTATSNNTGSITYNPTAIDADNETKASNFEYTPTSVTDIATLDDDPFDLGSADYLDDFLNDPNLYETNEEPSKNSDKNNENTSDSIKNSVKSDDIIKLLNGDVTKNNKSESKKSKSSSNKSNDSSKKHSKHTDKSKYKHSDTKSSHHSSSSDKREKSRHNYSKTKRKESSSSSSKDHSSSKEHKSTKYKHSSSHHSSSKSSRSKHSSSKDKAKKSRSSSSSERNSSSKCSSKHHSSSKSSSKSKAESTEKPSENQKGIKNNENVSYSIEEIDLLHEDDMFDYDSDDPTTSMEECKKIFEEYIPPEINEESEPVFSKPMDENTNNLPSSKKRVAHEKQYKSFFKPTARPTLKKSIESPAQVMVRRYQQMKEQVNKLAKENNATPPPTYEPTPVSGVKRIARVPNVSSLINAKKKVEELIKEKILVQKTPSQTLSKGDKRVSHVPDVSTLDIPMVLQADKSKLPINVRTRYLQMMVTECTKLYSSKESIIERALNEELNCYTRCSVLSTYRNSAMLAVNRLRKEHKCDV